MDDALIAQVGSHIVVARRFSPRVDVIGPMGRIVIDLMHPQYSEPTGDWVSRFRWNEARFRDWVVRQTLIQRVIPVDGTVFAIRFGLPKLGHALILLNVNGEQLAATHGEPKLLTWVDGDFGYSIATDAQGNTSLVRFAMDKERLSRLSHQ